MPILSSYSDLPCWQSPLLYSLSLGSTNGLTLLQCSLLVMLKLADPPWTQVPLQVPEASGLPLAPNAPTMLLYPVG